MEPKGYQKGAQSGQNGAKGTFFFMLKKCAKRRSKKQKKDDVQKRSVQGRSRENLPVLPGALLAEKVVQKAPFWKSRKSKMAPKPPDGGKIGTGTL
jgi:hypothetical protein